ncbi:hypothetical protein IF2G_06441 [Cordyceps javanica]|nr:hypothetical protein IF2G_06441 [Cordyceps javanica]
MWMLSRNSFGTWALSRCGRAGGIGNGRLRGQAQDNGTAPVSAQPTITMMESMLILDRDLRKTDWLSCANQSLAGAHHRPTSEVLFSLGWIWQADAWPAERFSSTRGAG